MRLVVSRPTPTIEWRTARCHLSGLAHHATIPAHPSSQTHGTCSQPGIPKIQTPPTPNRLTVLAGPEHQQQSGGADAQNQGPGPERGGPAPLHGLWVLWGFG